MAFTHKILVRVPKIDIYVRLTVFPLPNLILISTNRVFARPVMIIRIHCSSRVHSKKNTLEQTCSLSHCCLH